MRALVCKKYGPPESHAVVEWDDPVPGDDDIAFDVHAAGLNFADVLIMAGQYQVRPPLPFIAGNEAAGVVTSVGRNVKRFKPGDRVIGALRGGAFADKSIVNESSAIAAPAKLDFGQAATFSVAYGTSYHAMKQSARLRAGETVLVLGASGGVGYAAVDLAKAMGARVIAAASSDEKLDFARRAGADESINYSDGELNKAVKALTDGRGADVVYDPVGGELALQALKATAWHGRFVVVGFASGTIPELPANLALLKEASIVGTWYGTWAERHPAEMLQNCEDLASMIEDGRINPPRPETFGFADFADAFRVITERRVLGKVALQMV
ncbi:MAG: NADPH:quinone oxidoreductase family protein [Woeseiaceae bacterium]|nr:NADPH:quinone oxidoreductase family protein [Woeseiaceae bacterium]